jgi:hypothetical protein
MDKSGMGAGCGCGCVGEKPPQDENAMRFMMGSGAAYLLYGGYVVSRRRPRWFPLWLSAVVGWFTLSKYLICTRCEYFGEPCDFYRLGTFAARMFERQPDKSLDAYGIASEGITVAIIQFLPMLASLTKPKMLIKFLILFAIGQYAQLTVCCRRCIQYSTDPWKRDKCPSYGLATRLFGSE